MERIVTQVQFSKVSVPKYKRVAADTFQFENSIRNLQNSPNHCTPESRADHETPG